MMTKPMWDYMNYYKSIDTMMSWKKIIYKADVSTRLFSNRNVDVFTVIVIN